VSADSYACGDAVGKVIAVDLVIRRCPPTPTDLLKGLRRLLERTDARPAAAPAP
jgi:Ni,Fe-hydrogenase III small subunit